MKKEIAVILGVIGGFIAGQYVMYNKLYMRVASNIISDKAESERLKKETCDDGTEE